MTSTVPLGMSTPSTLPMKWIPSMEDSFACASTTRGGPFWGSTPLESSATLGRSFREMMRAYAEPITAKATRSSAVASTVAPTSRMSENGSSFSPRVPRVGYTAASAARRTPGISLKCRAHASTPAPVLPAETRAWASPSATSWAATATEACFLRASASPGFSSMPMKSAVC